MAKRAPRRINLIVSITPKRRASVFALVVAPLLLGVVGSPPPLPVYRIPNGEQVVVAPGSAQRAFVGHKLFLQMVLVNEPPQDARALVQGIPPLFAGPSGDCSGCTSGETISAVSQRDLDNATSALIRAGIPAQAIRAELAKASHAGVTVGRFLINVTSRTAGGLQHVLRAVARAQRQLEPQMRDCHAAWLCRVATANWWLLGRLRIANVIVEDANCAETSRLRAVAEQASLQQALFVSKAIGARPVDDVANYARPMQPKWPLLVPKYDDTQYLCGKANAPSFPRFADVLLQNIALGLSPAQPRYAHAAFLGGTVLRVIAGAGEHIHVPQMPASSHTQAVSVSMADLSPAPVRLEMPPDSPYVEVPGFFRVVIEPKSWLVVTSVAAKTDGISPAALAGALRRAGIPKADIGTRSDAVLIRVTRPDLRVFTILRSRLATLSPHSSVTRVPFVRDCPAVKTAVAANAYRDALGRATVLTSAVGTAVGRLIAVRDLPMHPDALCSGDGSDAMSAMLRAARSYSTQELLDGFSRSRDGSLYTQFSDILITGWKMVRGSRRPQSRAASKVVTGMAVVRLNDPGQCLSASLAALRRAAAQAFARAKGKVHALIDFDESIDERAPCSLGNGAYGVAEGLASPANRMVKVTVHVIP